MKRLKVAIFGNNLNQGYNLAEFLVEYGLQAKVFLYNYKYNQEKNFWWEDKDINPDLVEYINVNNIQLTWKTMWNSRFRQKLYSKAKEYDVIYMMEKGPAIFVGLNGPKKLFHSMGADLLTIPFYMETYFPRGINLKNLLLIPYYIMIQNKQRIGIRQCDHVIISMPSQQMLLERIGVNLSKVKFFPLPVKESIYNQVNDQDVKEVKEKYKNYDLVFFHPCRQYFLHLDNDIYLKDNDKLFLAFAQFIYQTKMNVKLVAIEKGRSEDLIHIKKLISQLNIEHYVEWLPELSNIKLRSYYMLDNVVVCDQFNPNLATLGNVGREASFYGCLLITSYREWNKKLYGDDIPPHIFPAMTVEEILEAMKRIERLSSSQKENIKKETKYWYERNLSPSVVIPKIANLIYQCVGNDVQGK